MTCTTQSTRTSSEGLAPKPRKGTVALTSHLSGPPKRDNAAASKRPKCRPQIWHSRRRRHHLSSKVRTIVAMASLRHCELTSVLHNAADWVLLGCPLTSSNPLGQGVAGVFQLLSIGGYLWAIATPCACLTHARCKQHACLQADTLPNTLLARCFFLSYLAAK